MIKRALTLMFLLAAAVAAWRRITGARDQLAGQRAAIEDSWAAAEDALRNRLTVLPEVAAAAPSRPIAEAILEAAARAKNAPDRAALISASTAIDDAVARWLVEVEGAPARPDREPLEERLREAEYKFANARSKYNSTLQTYNVALEMFPARLAARLFGFRRSDAYIITEWPQKSEPAGPREANRPEEKR